jgi:hypothetical protein
MLHENPLMLDIDVDQWRNLHETFLTSARRKKRIIIIHDGGVVLKFIHSHGEDIVKTINKITDPKRDAKKVYEDNKGKADFVLVLERKAVEHYFAEIQDSWRADEDLDEYIYRMYSKLDECKDGIVTYPEQARKTLGLRWRLAISYPQFKEVIQRYLSPNSVVVIGVFEKNIVWESLVLGFDEKMKLKLITTIDKSLVTRDWKEECKQVVKWVEKKLWKCSLGLFIDRENMETILKSEDRLRTLKDLIEEGKVIVTPTSETLHQQLAWLKLHPIS